MPKKLNPQVKENLTGAAWLIFFVLIGWLSGFGSGLWVAEGREPRPVPIKEIVEQASWLKDNYPIIYDEWVEARTDPEPEKGASE